ncbi:MAG: hypothetical protein MUF75_05990 [Bacteroidia bacterium]|jgi:hypothetical protein|nr:hypothetical protein [Bacteroidia bacterium]
MKNLLLLFSVAALFASSCSSKIGIAKRKYGKGYYVSVSHQPKAAEAAKNVKQVRKMSPEAIAQVRVNATEGLQSNAEINAVKAPIQVKENLAVPEKGNSNKEVFQASASKNKDFKNNAIIKSLGAVSLNKLSTSKKADDTMTILLVILCLFWWLNLIAVYLHQGKKITNDFWITLILDLLIIFGIIYSILVVLDVLSFA